MYERFTDRARKVMQLNQSREWLLHDKLREAVLDATTIDEIVRDLTVGQ
jgi:hypothetical protein